MFSRCCRSSGLKKCRILVLAGACVGAGVWAAAGAASELRAAAGGADHGRERKTLVHHPGKTPATQTDASGTARAARRLAAGRCQVRACTCTCTPTQSLCPRCRNSCTEGGAHLCICCSVLLLERSCLKWSHPSLTYSRCEDNHTSVDRCNHLAVRRSQRQN